MIDEEKHKHEKEILRKESFAHGAKVLVISYTYQNHL